MSVLDGIQLDSMVDIEEKKLTQYCVEELQEHTSFELSEKEIRKLERDRKRFGKRLKEYHRQVYRRSPLSIQRYQNITLHFIVQEFFRTLQEEAHVDYARPLNIETDTLQSEEYRAEIRNKRSIKIYKDGETYTHIHQAFQVKREETQLIVPDIRAGSRIKYPKRQTRRKKALETLLGMKTGVLAVYTTQNWKKARHVIRELGREDHALILDYDTRLFEDLAYRIAQQAVYGQTEKLKQSNINE